MMVMMMMMMKKGKEKKRMMLPLDNDLLLYVFGGWGRLVLLIE